MKRIALFLLALLLMAGCRGTVSLAHADQTATEAPTPTPTPAAEAAGTPPTEEAPPALRSLLRYEFGDLSEGQMFSFDLDQDGVEETFSFALRPDDEWATAISMDDSTVVVAAGDEPVSAEILDLDPASPFYNLLLKLDYGSDSYVTVELHPEDGELVQGPMIWGSYSLHDDALSFSECSYLLGTFFGKRTYRGDNLTPDSVWLEVTAPTEEELQTDLAGLMDVGTVIHCVKPVPCVIDGQAATIPEDTCMYVIRFMESDVDLVAEVRTLDGIVAQLLFYDDEDEPHDPDRICTMETDEYFDNLFWAD